MDELRKMLRKYLCIYWSRPETAIWRTCDWLATKHFEFERPMLDLACGDGLNSFVRVGNDPPLEIDDALSVKDVTPKEFFEDFVGIVFGEIIYGYDLKIFISLILEALKTLGKEASCVGNR